MTQILLSGLAKSNRLPARPAVPYLIDRDWAIEVSPGRAAVVTADSPCLLANLFYILTGELRIDRGSISIDGQVVQYGAERSGEMSIPPLRPQDRGLGVVDFRSALWWDRTLLDNVAAPLAQQEEVEARARSMLERCGVVDALHGAQMPRRWRERARRERDPAERELLLRAADDVLLARPGMLPNPLAHKQVELAREMVQSPRLLLVLDSCDCAGQPSAEALYPLYAELAADCDGLLLFTRRPPESYPFAESVYRFRELAAGVALERRPLAEYEPPEDTSELPEDQIVLRLQGLSRRFGSVTVIDEISFDVPKSQVTVIMGGSGCGKSTLLRMVAGIIAPTTGEVYFNHREEGRPTGLVRIVDPRTRPSKETRKAFGVLFQDGALFNSMTVSQNVSAPILEHTDLHQNVIDLMVQIKLDLVAMWGNDPEHAEHGHKYPSELSGGQKKRVGLARALALDPQVIFYDEPSAGLDPIVSRQIDELIVQLGEVLGVTSIVITHELDSAFEIADQMVVLRKGNEKENEYWGPARMVAQGDREEITACVQPHVMEFLDVMSYHHEMPLAQYHKNWYSGLFGSS